MSEYQPFDGPQKSNPDAIDPTKITSRPSPWGLAIPLLMTLATFAFVWSISLGSNPYAPGAWLGNVPWTEDFTKLTAAFISALVAFLAAVVARHKLAATVLVIVFCGMFGWALTKKHGHNSDGTARYRAEIAQYKDAIKTGKPFGDQYSLEIGGRKLTYWRWAQMGLDDAIGVMYDPVDKFPNGEEDSRAFREQTHGGLFRTKKMEPHWTISWHS